VRASVRPAEVTEQFGAHGQGLRRRDLAERLEPLAVHDDRKSIMNSKLRINPSADQAEGTYGKASE